MKALQLLVVFFCQMSTTQVQSIYTMQKAQEILQSIQLSKYHNSVKPPTKNDEPLDVTLWLSFWEMLPLNPRYYRIEIEMLLKWNDPRFASKIMNTNESLVLERDVDKNIWIPDIFVMDEVKGKEGYKPIQKVSISPQGDIQFARRLNLEMFCQMDYWWFPFDRQTCEITFQAFAYPTTDLKLHWPEGIGRDEIVDSSGLKATEYILTDYHISERLIGAADAGTFNVLVLTLELKRMANYYMSQHILPLNLNIILSMTTFWIDHKCVKARITIPLVNVLTLTKQTSALKATIPFQKSPVSMEYYLNFSIFFVFMVLIEYCLIGLFKVKVIRKSEKRKTKRNSSMMPVVGGAGNHDHPDFCLESSMSHYSVNDDEEDPSDDLIHPLDKKSRYIYPLCFIFYNVLYFSLLITNQGLSAF